MEIKKRNAIAASTRSVLEPAPFLAEFHNLLPIERSQFSREDRRRRELACP